MRPERYFYHMELSNIRISKSLFQAQIAYYCMVSPILGFDFLSNYDTIRIGHIVTIHSHFTHMRKSSLQS